MKKMNKNIIGIGFSMLVVAAILISSLIPEVPMQNEISDRDMEPLKSEIYISEPEVFFQTAVLDWPFPEGIISEHDLDGNLHVVFTERGLTNDSIYYMVRSASDRQWTTPELISHDTWATFSELIIDADHNIHVFWRNSSFTGGETGIIYCRIRNATTNLWEDRTIIVDDLAGLYKVQIVGGNIHLVYKNNSDNIYLNYTNMGWSESINLSISMNDFSFDAAGNLHYLTYSNPNRIYRIRYANGTLSEPEIYDIDSTNFYATIVAEEGGNVHIVMINWVAPQQHRANYTYRNFQSGQWGETILLAPQNIDINIKCPLELGENGEIYFVYLMDGNWSYVVRTTQWSDPILIIDNPDILYSGRNPSMQFSPFEKKIHIVWIGHPDNGSKVFFIEMFDNDIPTIELPQGTTYVQNIDVNFSWKAKDVLGLTRTYVIYQNSTVNQTGNWQSEQINVLNLTNWEIGFHNITISVTDGIETTVASILIEIIQPSNDDGDSDNGANDQNNLSLIIGVSSAAVIGAGGTVLYLKKRTTAVEGTSEPLI